MTSGVFRKSQAVIAGVIFATVLIARPSAGQDRAAEPAPTPVSAAEPAPAAAAAPASSSVEKQTLHRKANSTSTNAGRTATPKTGVTPAPASGASEVVRVVCALGGVIALILLLRWVAKRYFGVTTTARGTRAVQVLSRSPISPRQQIVILRVGKRLLVVADGGTQMSTLSEITDPDEIASLIGQVQEDHTDRATKVFGKVFDRMRGKFDAAADAADGHHEERSHAGLVSGVQKRLFELDRDERHVVDGDNDEDETSPATIVSADPDDPASLTSTREEMSGLMDKIKLLSRQFKS